jgi:hypothetical protein
MRHLLCDSLGLGRFAALFPVSKRARSLDSVGAGRQLGGSDSEGERYIGLHSGLSGSAGGGEQERQCH